MLIEAAKRGLAALAKLAAAAAGGGGSFRGGGGGGGAALESWLGAALARIMAGNNGTNFLRAGALVASALNMNGRDQSAACEPLKSGQQRMKQFKIQKMKTRSSETRPHGEKIFPREDFLTSAKRRACVSLVNFCSTVHPEYTRATRQKYRHDQNKILLQSKNTQNHSIDDEMG
jgi:hypothetical protein